MIGSLLGGIGLFLLGMGLLTDGLQTAAGDNLRRALRRYTRTPLSGVATGAVVTTLVQSSSVTAVAAIGFVGAGLLPFSQALGLIYGANVGTTATGWIVATLGLKVKMSAVALPLVGVGALGKLFLRGRRSALAMALAGFGLLFVGIDVLQEGMQRLSTRIDPATYVGQGAWGYLLLVGVGIVMTVIMQSSSAAVATTLTAVHGGALGLQEAAAVVIGQNVGTTVTAMIGAIGASVPARRIALAHLGFNLGTGAVALILLPVFIAFIVRGVGVSDPALALTTFHSAFNVLGVVLFLPLTGRFVTLLTRLVPDGGRALTSRLTAKSSVQPAIAVEAARQTALELAVHAFRLVHARLTRAQGRDNQSDARPELHAALRTTREYVHAVRTDAGTPAVYREHIGVLHALDHLFRLTEALGEEARAELALTIDSGREIRHELALRLQDAMSWLSTPEQDDLRPLELTARHLARFRRQQRHELLARTARGELDASAAEATLEALRWLDRVGYHAWRAVVHLERADRDVPPPELSSNEHLPNADERYDVLP